MEIDDGYDDDDSDDDGDDDNNDDDDNDTDDALVCFWVSDLCMLQSYTSDLNTVKIKI